MREQTHNTDMSDEPDRQDLEDRVEQLEATIAKMLPSRRDALKLGGAALVGGAAMSGSASAGTQQAGTIGTANNPVDVESEDITNADTIKTQNLLPESVGNGYRFAGAYNGNDPDTRLTAALSAASNGDTIFLENDSYSGRTITDRVALIGTLSSFSGTDFTGDLILDNTNIDVSNIDFKENKVIVNNGFSKISEIVRADVEVNSRTVLVVDSFQVNVTFASGTNKGLADSLIDNSSVTDNGNNIIGDVG